jgi:hypothetical protein
MWWPWKKEDAPSRVPPRDDVPEPEGEFESADLLDNDVPADKEGVAAADLALEALRGRHLAFRTPEKCEECSLEELRLNILMAVTEDATLDSYYQEAWGDRTAPAATAASLTRAHRRVAAMQIELMSRAFIVLQLQLFANAPENLGWMTLFRRWGRSPLFNLAFKEMEPTLQPGFAKFYRRYLEDLPALASASQQLPIHHPWLLPEESTLPAVSAARREAMRGRGLYMDSGRMEAEIDVRPGTGSVTDQQGPEGDRQGFEKTSDTPPDTGSTPAPNE